MMAIRPGSRRAAYDHRLKRMRDQGMKPPLAPHEGDEATERPKQNAAIDCGWGRLLFGQTFGDAETLAEAMRAEKRERRDIAFYIRDPHLILAAAPQDLFLDPSHTYRLDLATYRSSRRKPRGFLIRRLASEDDAVTVNRIYAQHHMVPVPPDFFWRNRDNRALTYLVAEDENTGDVIGTVTGVNHSLAFNDPERGSSLWCLAVDPQAGQPGIGEALVRRLAEHMKARRAAYLDLSVVHDNKTAIALYDKLGFKRVPYFAIKRKNPINEPLYAGPAPDETLNPYARIIVNEARRRGVNVEIIDAEGGFFRLSYGGRSIRCREALTDLTSSVAMSICDDKAVTRRLMEQAGLSVPAQLETEDEGEIKAFLAEHGSLVVKPARGEQGRGVAVGVETPEAVAAAMENAKRICDRVLVESCSPGEDLRLVVIGFELVAAAIRRPAQVTGDGHGTVRELIRLSSRRRAAATGGESRIPLDDETMRCIDNAGVGLDDVLPEGTVLMVRKTANLHTGGTIHDVTDDVHPKLAAAAVTAARVIDIPVVGIDFIVPSHTEPTYVFIEANERPGLANHEPQPTAERFIDLLFPLSMRDPASAPAMHAGGR
jgi:GNAT-family acetyltransferase (TIGR03103 family)